MYCCITNRFNINSNGGIHLVKIIECTTKEQIMDHFIIRKLVFVDEQQVSMEEEFDLTEKNRTLFLVYDQNKPIGTARINFLQEYAKLERICILKEYRKKNIGKFLINELIKYCQQNNYYNIHLGSQVQAIGFYEKCGFVKYGEMYYDANIPHYNMKKES